MRNCPGPASRPARNRYVRGWWTSRTTSRSGTISSLAMGRPHEVRDRSDPALLEEGQQFRGHVHERGETARRERRADLDRAGARHHVFEGVAARRDPADADDRHVDRLEDFVYASDAHHPDLRTAQPAVAVRQA